jgi:hypothetical protein
MLSKFKKLKNKSFLGILYNKNYIVFSFCGFGAITSLYFEQYRIAFIAVIFLIMNYTSFGSEVLRLRENLMKTRNEIKSEIREKHYYLYYGDTLLGFGIILGFVLGFTIFKDSSQFHEFLGILI